MEKIIILIIIIFVYLIIRKITYNRLIQYKSVDSFNSNVKINYEIDNIFNNIETDGCKIGTIESDYSKIDLSMLDSYNVCYLREYIYSNPTDSTIQLAEISDNMKILDMGAGTGKVAIYMCQKFKNIHIDCVINTKNLYDVIIKNVKKHELTDRINVYLMDFNEEIPNNKNYYDRILFLETIGYSRNRLKLLNDSVKLLKTNGKLFIKTPSFDNCVPSQYNEEINDTIKTWCYNFSTINSLINDVKKIPNTNSKYISFKLHYCLLFNNLDDIKKALIFCFVNKINLFKYMLFGIFYANEDFVLIEKLT